MYNIVETMMATVLKPEKETKKQRITTFQTQAESAISESNKSNFLPNATYNKDLSSYFFSLSTPPIPRPRPRLEGQGLNIPEKRPWDKQQYIDFGTHREALATV